ncbi:DNA mismatch repair protein MutL [Coemansia reversa NRRL 1564]|uniref:DNA mismatch repair protein MutL n=1 Tax=Coemansia reversa (strain ATCC 12441 / NRRL 1564) TaxID=763665 RepID=A0A2G5B9G6_COERN|nr:DNA mismatch repair protein MutL [Coemansia reversa NRRL 1564]|eukprot:PIA15367.1 DNA mismatch repair protein MutL [Coemansia reversa NRRL 1564]
MHAIGKDTVRQLCAGQVVVDLATSVKELLENSLDAAATNVDIKLKDSGLTSIIVADNGQGIDEANFATVCRKHWTSKISSFEDLEGVATFGFRGEALSSLCAVANVTITTATRESAPMGVELEFDNSGELLAQKPTARERGTTIKLTGLFAKWPVRQQDLRKNVRREYLRLVTLIEQYAVISDGVRLSLTNQTRGGNTVSLRTMPQSDRFSRLLTIFGTQMRPHIVNFEHCPTAEDEDISINGHISKPIPEAGRSASDRQFFFVNGRPCDFPKAKKLVNEMYRDHCPTRFPLYSIEVIINPRSIDVNLTPDKRTILIRHESLLLSSLRKALALVFEPSESVFNVSRVQTQLLPTTTPSDSATHQPATTGVVDGEPRDGLRTVTAETSVPGVIRCYVEDNQTDGSANQVETGQKRQAAGTLEPNAAPLPTRPKIGNHERYQIAAADSTRPVAENVVMAPVTRIPQPKVSTGLAEGSRTTTLSNKPKQPQQHAPQHQTKRLSTMVVGGCRNRMQNDVYDWTRVSQRLRVKQSRHAEQLEKSQQLQETEDVNITAEVEQGGIHNANNPEEANTALSRLIHKKDFANMEIIGQFNHGFIIVKLGQDLYIIDQHASDEKYNYEQLQERAIIQSQPLIHPTILELSIVDESIAIEYEHILLSNGFHIKIDQDGLPGRRISLLSQPFIDQTLFNQQDLLELIGKLSVSPDSIPRCDRARRMFASRACRKSIMIGHPLSFTQMRSVVGNLSSLDHPWNCPHGRPTMRHLHRLPV